MITWIRKGRVIVSADGRWRITNVLWGWDLLDSGRVIASGYMRAETAQNKAENEERFEAQRRRPVMP